MADTKIPKRVRGEKKVENPCFNTLIYMLELRCFDLRYSFQECNTIVIQGFPVLPCASQCRIPALGRVNGQHVSILRPL